MKLSRFNKVILRDIWKHEALDFTQWLAKEENLTLLAEELGIELISAQTEVSVGNFNVDILAEDSNGHRVIIENQLESTNHDHLGKLITYASGLQAATAIWIVERAREEHEQAINWLNEHTTEDANFFLLEIEVWRIGESDPAPRFNVVCKPNDWAKVVRQSGGASKLSELKLEQQTFWDNLREYGEQNPSNSLRSWQKAQPQHWYNISIGSSKAHIAATINSRKECVGIELYITGGKELFHAIYADREAIEGHLGNAVQWMELPDKKTSRILITHDGNFLDPESRQQLIEWLYANAETFAKVFSPYLRR